MQHVSTIYARFITRELQLSQFEIDRLLQNTSLNAKELFTLNSMAYSDFFNFLITVNQQFSDDELGLKVGKKLTPISLGELGNAMLVAPNLLESLSLASKFSWLHADYMNIHLIANFESVSIIFTEQTELGQTQQFQTEVLLLLIQNIIEAITSTPFTEGKFHFPYSIPTNHKHYKSYFNSPIHFNEQHACIEIPKSYLYIQSPFHNPVIWKSYQLKFVSQLNSLVQTNNKPFTHHVNDLLNACPPPLPKVVDTAARLNITERTLNRRLKNEGSSYRNIRNDVMRRHAEFYLNETDLTVDAIACQLGYKDFSSFRRAFKQWTNLTPQAFRQQNRDE